MNADSLKRRIRKLLLLAADGRGSDHQASSALALAARLMKANGLTEAECREAGDDMPGDVKARVILKGDKNYHRHTIISQVTIFSVKTVAISARASSHANLSIIDIRGKKEDVEQATRIWSELYRLFQGEWHAAEMTVGQARAMEGFLRRPVPSSADEFSWLTGLLQGYCTADAHHQRWVDTMKSHEEKLKLKDAQKPKRKKKFGIPKFNPLAVMCVPKKHVEPIAEDPEPISEPTPQEESPIDAAMHDPEEERPNARKLDEYSWKLGYRFGMQVFEKMSAIQQNGH